MQERRCDNIAILVHEAGQVLGNEAQVAGWPLIFTAFRQVKHDAQMVKPAQAVEEIEHTPV